MKSIVFAILLYFVCASITCNKTEKNDAVNTVANILPVPVTNCTGYYFYFSPAAIGIFADKKSFPGYTL